LDNQTIFVSLNTWEPAHLILDPIGKSKQQGEIIRFFNGEALRSSVPHEEYDNQNKIDNSTAGLQLAGDNLVEFLSSHDKAITAIEMIDDYVLSRLPELQVIGKYGVGLDMIDFNAMRRYGKRRG
jgi:phosphoglycerate dehydrogenase-like enzyme